MEVMKVQLLATLSLVFCLTLQPCFAAYDPKACRGKPQYLTKESGTIDFPGGNREYSNRLHCGWAIVGKRRSTITIDFTSINIKEGHPCNDYVRMYSMGSHKGKKVTTPLSERLCPSDLGKMKKKTFSTAEIILYIGFRSDSRDAGRGFTLNWKVEHSGTAMDPKACSGKTHYLEEKTGTIDFPSGNREYSNGLHCGWAIMSKRRSTITIDFTSINIKEGHPCKDYVRIYSISSRKGRKVHTPLSESLCPSDLGRMTKKTFSTTESILYIGFRSDSRDTGRGFTLNWKIELSAECRGKGESGEEGESRGKGNGKSCPNPGTLRNGRITGATEYFSGTTVTFKCNENYGLNGPSSMTCSSSGRWSSSLPTCIASRNDISSLNCNFDRGNLCGWSSEKRDPLSWKAQVAKSSGWKGWGKVDHTTGRGTGYYAYLRVQESSKGRKGSLKSYVLSPGPDTGRCLTFYYSMPQTDSYFNVIMQYNDGREQSVLHREGLQGFRWSKATVSLLSKRPFSIIFEHARGSKRHEIGLAIDDVVLTDKQCPSRLNSCGTNIYGDTKKRRSLLKASLGEEKKEEQEEELNAETKENGRKKRIIGGMESRRGEFPWIVHLKVFADGVASRKFYTCAGSIIDEQWILTVAVCFETRGFLNTDPETVRIYLGEHNTQHKEVEESQFVLVPEKIIPHPDRDKFNKCVRSRYQNDIALLKLKYKLTFTDYVNVVCLPETSFPPGTGCIVAGWGYQPDGSLSGTLNHLEKNIQSAKDCTFRIKDDRLCAIVPWGIGDVCDGDAGGPLQCKRSNKYELAGAVSSGSSCSKFKRTSSIYVDVYYFMPWIKSTID